MKDKNILLCVTGGIAAYKSAALTSKLIQKGANVRVIMTKAATHFISPITFQAISKNAVYTDVFDEIDPSIIAHIDLADWADVVIVAPATANIIAKFANGIADDMVSSTFLAMTSPVFIAPSMNVHMYNNFSTQNNIQVLKTQGYHFIEPGTGMLACGYEAKGRMEEPENIIKQIEDFIYKSRPLSGQTVLVTAGPTIESIDPFRFISNHSTGTMGYAIATEAAKLGAKVILISGPTALPVPPNVTFIPIQSAQEMYEAVISKYDQTNIVIKAAAVADYRPSIAANHKIKKKDGDLKLELERTTDILKELGRLKKNQFLVGFAAETQNIEAYATEKLHTKNLDMIVANDISDANAGFGKNTNIVTIYKKNGKSISLPLLNKSEVAQELFKLIIKEGTS